MGFTLFVFVYSIRNGSRRSTNAHYNAKVEISLMAAEKRLLLYLYFSDSCDHIVIKAWNDHAGITNSNNTNIFLKRN